MNGLHRMPSDVRETIRCLLSLSCVLASFSWTAADLAATFDAWLLLAAADTISRN